MPNSDSQYESRRFLVVRRFRDLPDALLFDSILDSAGIECFLADENTIRMDWFWSNLLGGVKLCVRKSDADAASSLLDQSVLEKFEVEGIGEYQQPRCPNCMSFEVFFEGLNKPVDYTRALLGGPRPLHRSLWQCDSCGHHWPESNEKPPANFLAAASSILMIVLAAETFLAWMLSLLEALRSAASL
jgi:hypothetical protein